MEQDNVPILEVWRMKIEDKMCNLEKIRPEYIYTKVLLWIKVERVRVSTDMDTMIRVSTGIHGTRPVNMRVRVVSIHFIREYPRVRIFLTSLVTIFFLT